MYPTSVKGAEKKLLQLLGALYSLAIDIRLQQMQFAKVYFLSFYARVRRVNLDLELQKCFLMTVSICPEI